MKIDGESNLATWNLKLKTSKLSSSKGTVSLKRCFRHFLELEAQTWSVIAFLPLIDHQFLVGCLVLPECIKMAIMIIGNGRCAFGRLISHKMFAIFLNFMNFMNSMNFKILRHPLYQRSWTTYSASYSSCFSRLDFTLKSPQTALYLVGIT